MWTDSISGAYHFSSQSEDVWTSGSHQAPPLYCSRAVSHSNLAFRMPRLPLLEVGSSISFSQLSDSRTGGRGNRIFNIIRVLVGEAGGMVIAA
ncbi:hypothetical protein NDU88_007534 [Pleurodeles waltl]|uniref:Uncharacterized protein n=1 Tax=Pleurodeles waltl TaxID=8319 RepID=A0AAV7U3Y8_PLEWA|nr:hypothetical protein NDU88_007534 [Pleurodeles waltl]